MNIENIEAYIEKIYGYAINHTYSREEADELSQEILFMAVRELPKLRDESKFEPWLWGVANNVTKQFRRNMGKQRAMYSYETLENLSYEDEYFDDQEEIYDLLRTRIAMLSKMYRDIIILYYYDGLSVKQISERLKIPEGTVTWRLSEARKKLKKECTDMNESALRPKTMRLDIYGNGNYNGKTIPFPTAYIDDSLSQNILYYCYDDARTVEDISKLCGVPAYYIEERIDNLLKREAIIESVKGKYQTNFVIFSDKYGIYCEENAEKVLLPIVDEIIEALKKISREAMSINFYKADRSEQALFYLFGAMAFSYASKKYCKLPYPWFKKRYDGNEWSYLGNMETGKHKRITMGIQQCANLGSRGGYSHTSYNFIPGIKFRQMMYDNYINACEDILYTGSCDDVDSVANAVNDGYIVRKEDGSFFVTSPSFTLEQNQQFENIVEKYLSPIMPVYSDAIESFVTGYKKLFPKHLTDDADRLCQNIFMGMYSEIIKHAQKTEKITVPSSNCYCDVMVQFK